MGLTILGACTEGGKSLTAPTSVRTATTSSGGFGNAKHVDLCVSSSSPAGNYTFVNSNENVNIGIYGQYDQGDGGTGSTAFNQPSGTAYTVAAGSCIRVLDRTAGNADYPVPTPFDSWAAVTMTNTGTPAGVTYDHTDCLLDNGTLATQPDPCGSTSNPTRAFANFEHGSVVTFVFVASSSNGRIAPTSTTCADYAKGAAPTLSDLFAGFKGTKIHNMSPGVFFYYASVTKGAGQAVGFTQTTSPNPGGLPRYSVHQGQAYLYSFNGSSCTTVATLNVSNDGKTASGGASLAAGTYVLGVKFNTDAPAGTDVGSAALTLSNALLSTSNFQATVAGAGQGSTAASVNTRAK